MPRVTRQHEQQVRERILGAALRVFGERGFHHATMQDIVRESGLSVGAFYTYFKSKDELCLAICDIPVDQTLASLGVRLAAGSPSAHKQATARGVLLDTREASD